MDEKQKQNTFCNGYNEKKLKQKKKMKNIFKSYINNIIHLDIKIAS